MKRFKLIAMAFAAISMFSCSKENVTEEVPLNGTPAVVTLRFEGTPEDPKSRATGTGETGTGDQKEAKLNDAIVFFFTGKDDNAKLVGSPLFVTFTNPDQQTSTFATTTDAKAVYVIANTGVTKDNFPTSQFLNVKSLAKLKEMKGDLFATGSVGTEATTQMPGKLWMAGSNDADFVKNGDKFTATVSLKFVASKIVVTITDNRRNKNVSDGTTTIIDTDISVLFAGGEGYYIGGDKDTHSKYYSGFATTTTMATTTVKNVLKTPLAKGTAANNSIPLLADPYHFYVFSQNAAQPIILVISSKKTDNGVESDTYYKVLFNAADGFSALATKKFEGGKKYTVNMILTGDVNGGAGGGDPDPVLPTSNANVDVTVKAATWGSNITISKTFTR